MSIVDSTEKILYSNFDLLWVNKNVILIKRDITNTVINYLYDD